MARRRLVGAITHSAPWGPSWHVPLRAAWPWTPRRGPDVWETLATWRECIRTRKGPFVENMHLGGDLLMPRTARHHAIGSVYVADSVNQRVHKVSAGGIITTVAGTGIASYSGNGGPADSSQLRSPRGLAIDGLGNLLIVDFGRIRKVSPDGTITTVTGNGSTTFSGDGGAAINAGNCGEPHSSGAPNETDRFRGVNGEPSMIQVH